MTTILGPAQAASDQACYYALGRGAPLEFACPVARAYWRLAPLVGIRPEVAYAQACHETGFGLYGRAVTPAHHNYCGLKVRTPGADDAADSHMRFPTIEVGVRAHLDHLALYAGAPGFPTPATPDPRHFPHLFGVSPTVETLGGSGRWAPNPAYGSGLVKHIDGILAQTT